MGRRATLANDCVGASRKDADDGTLGPQGDNTVSGTPRLMEDRSTSFRELVWALKRGSRTLIVTMVVVVLLIGVKRYRQTLD